MVVVKDWKKYYTVDEMDKHFDKFINNSADELIVELRKRRSKEEWSKLVSKEKVYA